MSDASLIPATGGGIAACPRCGQWTLAAVLVGDAQAARCLRCSGHWIPRSASQALRGAFPTIGNLDRASLAEVKRAAAERNLADGVHYLPCPSCSTRMDRRLFATGSAIVIDRCLAHGIWFDGGELELAAAYFRAGGPHDAARRDAERSPREPLHIPSGSTGPSEADSALLMQLLMWLESAT